MIVYGVEKIRCCYPISGQYFYLFKRTIPLPFSPRSDAMSQVGVGTKVKHNTISFLFPALEHSRLSGRPLDTSIIRHPHRGILGATGKRIHHEAHEENNTMCLLFSALWNSRCPLRGNGTDLSKYYILIFYLITELRKD